MAVVLIKEVITKNDLVEARKDYGDYIKVDVDIVTGLITIGGEWHSDGEKILLENGSKQGDIWGGGVNLSDNSVDFNSLINVRPQQNNNSQEILSGEIRKLFEQIVRQKFKI